MVTVTPVCSSFAGHTATFHDKTFLHALMGSCNSVQPRSAINKFLHDLMYSCDSVRLLCY